MGQVALKQKIGLTPEQLCAEALANGEGELCPSNGALRVETGARTGRSPKDKFIVKDNLTRDTVAWGGVNRDVSRETFDTLWQRAEAHIENLETYKSLLCVGADPRYTVPVEVTTEYAWHNLFVQHLFIRDVPKHDASSRWHMLNVPSFTLNGPEDGVNSDGAVLVDFSQKKVLLCGMRYAGEMKKAMFGVLNYLLPSQDVLPMHCAANVDADGKSALFFGLSGTGKTTLSADPDRFLLGDDEHGWGPDVLFNFEGGCYAKCIDLSQEREPVIWNAIKSGAVMENVVVSAETGEPDYADASLTQNTRAAYPLTHIEKRVANSIATPPKVVIFLTCDLFGVLPPVSRLSLTQAAYYFLSGYTALVGSTEIGSPTGVSTTFSSCFGAPFFPRPAQVYADLLMKRVTETNARVYLVNTGWTGGGYAEGGKRFDIPTTRRIVGAALTGEIEKSNWTNFSDFDFAIPESLDGVDASLLNPENTWQDKARFAEKKQHLIKLFVDNFEKFSVDQAIKDAGPKG